MTTQPIKQPVQTLTPQLSTLTFSDLPTDPVKLRQWLLDVATRQEVWQRGRMQPLEAATTIVILREGLKYLQTIEKRRAEERRGYLLKRYSTAFLTLDAAQPSEGDVIVAERKDGQREQCIVGDGVAWTWRNGGRGVKFANVASLARWRPCDMPEPVVNPPSVANDVQAALARGRELAGNGEGLKRAPGAGQAKSVPKTAMPAAAPRPLREINIGN